MDDDRRIDHVVDALRAIRNAPIGEDRPTEFGVVRAHADMVRLLRRARRALAVAASTALVAGVAIVFLLVTGGPSSDPARRSLPPRTETAVPRGVPRLVRFEPAGDLIVLADETASVRFPSTDRIALDDGAIVLELRAEGTSRRLFVETPTAAVLVTGTVVAITVAPAGTTVEVLRGRVTVMRDHREPIEVPQGMLLRPDGTGPEPLPAGRSERLAVLFPCGTRCERATDPQQEGAEIPVAARAEKASPFISSTTTAPPPALPDPVRSSTVEGLRVPPAATAETTATDDLYAAAERARREGRVTEAVALLEEVASTVVPGSAREETVLFDLADLYRALGDARGHRRCLDRYLDRHPAGTFREDARLEICRLLEETGSEASRRSCLRAYVDEFPAGRMADRARTALEGVDRSAGSPDGG